MTAIATLMSETDLDKLFADFRQLIQDAQTPEQIEEMRISLQFTSLDPDRLGVLENLLAGKVVEMGVEMGVEK